MKPKFLIPLIAGCGLCLAQFTAFAQPFKMHVNRTFSLSGDAKNTIVSIGNIFGSVRVEGYAGNKVIIDIDETITGNTNQDVEQGKNEFKMGLEQKGDSILAYITSPYYTKPHSRRWDNEHDHDIDYRVNLEFVIKVPNNVNLQASTVNDGDIIVNNVYGALKVKNVNGAIDITNAKGATDARTVNGGVTINYLSTPTDVSSYATINGKMSITYPASLAADLQFKSMNGAFYTDFPDAQPLPSQVTKTEDKRANGTTYKLNKNTQVRIGGGGKLFKFETLNGNIYIKKQH